MRSNNTVSYHNEDIAAKPTGNGVPVVVSGSNKLLILRLIIDYAPAEVVEVSRVHKKLVSAFRGILLTGKIFYD